MSNESWDSFQSKYGKQGSKTKLLASFGFQRCPESGKYTDSSTAAAAIAHAASASPDALHPRKLQRGVSDRSLNISRTSSTSSSSSLAGMRSHALLKSASNRNLMRKQSSQEVIASLVNQRRGKALIAVKSSSALY